MKEHWLPAGRERSPEYGGVLLDYVLEDCGEKVLDTPTRHNRVIEHYSCTDEGNSTAHPSEFIPPDFIEGTDNAHAGFFAKGKLYGQYRNRPEEEKNEPGNDEGTSTMLGNDSRETPYIPSADSHPDPSKDNSPSGGRCFSTFHVASTLLFRNFSVND